MKYFTSTPVCLETSCFQREVNTSSRLQENISLACQLLLFQLDWKASSCSHTLFLWSDCRRQMRAKRVVAFVVYFRGGLFSEKKKIKKKRNRNRKKERKKERNILKFSHGIEISSASCWVALKVGFCYSPFPLAAFYLGLTSDVISVDGQALNSLCWLPECFCFSV